MSFKIHTKKTSPYDKHINMKMHTDLETNVQKFNKLQSSWEEEEKSELQ